MPGYRKERIEEQIKQVIGEALLKEVKDPRIGFVTISSVKLSKDKSVADIGVSIIGSESEKRKSMMGMASASSFLQHVIATEMNLRITPKIRFHLDTSIEESVRMDGLIDSISKKNQE